VGGKLRRDRLLRRLGRRSELLEGEEEVEREVVWA